jgi:hypothetical protein
VIFTLFRPLEKPADKANSLVTPSSDLSFKRAAYTISEKDFRAKKRQFTLIKYGKIELYSQQVAAVRVGADMPSPKQA